MSGKLYIVPTPIGNLKDITIRALEVLNYVDIIACEDTRHSLKLLNHYDIKKPLFSYHKFNELTKCKDFVDRLNKGENIALISDAGMPVISDPGSYLIQSIVENGLDFEVLPGANAAICALVASSISAKDFIFKGFLPWDKGSRTQVLEDIKGRKETIIFYEAPHRLIKTLESILEILGDRKIGVCRELTKIHEEIVRDNIGNVIEYFKGKQPKGEFVLVVQGRSEEEIKTEEKKAYENLSIKEHIEKYMKDGNSKKEAIKKVAIEREIPKSEVYKFSLDIENSID